MRSFYCEFVRGWKFGAIRRAQERVSMKIGEIHLHVNGILFFKDTQCSLSYGFGIFGFSVRCIQLGARRVFPFLSTLVTWFLSLSLSLYFLWSFRLRLLLVYVLIPHYCFLCSRFSCHFIPEWWLLNESRKFVFQRIIQSVCFPSTAALRHWSCLDKHEKNFLPSMLYPGPQIGANA